MSCDRVQVIFLFVHVIVTYEVSPFKTKPQGYKTFSMPNSAEHEILNARKYTHIKKFSFFQAHISLECYFSCLLMLKCQQLLAF